MDFLQSNVAGIVICEPNLRDGSWKDLFAKASKTLTSPLLVVCSEDVDPELWAEVLNLGAYDVLSKPFDSAEVTRIVSLAWLHWKEQSKPAPKSDKRPAGSEGGPSQPTRGSTAPH